MKHSCCCFVICSTFYAERIQFHSHLETINIDEMLCKEKLGAPIIKIRKRNATLTYRDDLTKTTHTHTKDICVNGSIIKIWYCLEATSSIDSSKLVMKVKKKPSVMK